MRDRGRGEEMRKRGNKRQIEIKREEERKIRGKITKRKGEIW